MTNELNIKLLNRIKDEVAQDGADKNGYHLDKMSKWDSYSMITAGVSDATHDEVCRRYAEEVNKNVEGKAKDLLLKKDYFMNRVVELEQEIERLKAFKDYVHKRLDDAGIEKDPESVHKYAGCRIGGRLDIVLNDMCTKVSRQKSCEASLEKAAERMPSGVLCERVKEESNIVIIEP